MESASSRRGRVGKKPARFEDADEAFTLKVRPNESSPSVLRQAMRVKIEGVKYRHNKKHNL